jgi:hypothetical protein
MATSVSHSDPSANLSSRLRIAISVFILFHLIVILCWALPVDSAPVLRVRQITRPYMVWIGLFQSWDTFAPNPKGINATLEAVAITESHRQKVWVFPRMEQLSYWQRYREERYRKFAEVLPQPQLAPMWPDVAQHLLPQFRDPSDSVAMILLIQNSAPMTPWRKTEPALTPHIFYEYINIGAAEGQP